MQDSSFEVVKNWLCNLLYDQTNYAEASYYAP